MNDQERFNAAIAAIDAANANDPNVLTVGGVERPKELAHAELMTQWVQKLDPEAADAQLLAARAHHLRRWSIPRKDFPEGRGGYLHWRTTLSKQHAAEVAEILTGVGYDQATVERVQTIIRKQHLATDAQVQTHEDALCLVFLETQFENVADRLGRDKTVDVVAKTLPKMSSKGLEAASGLSLDSAGAEMLAAAVAQTGESA